MWKYIKSILFAVLVVVFFNICFAIVQISGIIGFHINPYLAIKTATKPEVITHLATQIGIFAICADIFVLISTFIIVEIFTKNKFKKIVKPVKFELKKLGVVIPVALGCVLIMSIVSSLIAEPFFKDPQINKLFAHMTTPMSIIQVVIIAPIVEEVMFRGILFNYIRKRSGNIVFAIIISSITFGIAHGNGEQGIYASILGVFLALIYLYTGSIFGDILVHMIANGVTTFQNVILSSFTGTVKTKILLDIVWIHLLVGIAMFLLAWYFYKKQKENKIKKGFFRTSVSLCSICLVFIVLIGILPNKNINKIQAGMNHKTKIVQNDKK